MKHAWTSTTLSELGCEAHVFAPDQPAGSGAILYLHDGDESGPADDLSAELARRGLRAVRPSTGLCLWSERIHASFHPQVSPERFLVEHLVPWAQDRWSLAAGQLAVLGVGMGGQGALRLAYRHPTVFPIAAAVAPWIDFQLLLRQGVAEISRMYPDEEAARQDTATLHIHPLNWPRHQFFCCDPEDPWWWDGADRLRMKLYSLGVPHEADLETTTDGDEAAYRQRMLPQALDFIQQRL